jgi:hypothetical protein
MAETISPEDWRKILAGQAKSENKYGAKAVVYNGHKYHSTKEANYAQTLDILKSSKDPAERVLKHDRQVTFSLDIKGIHICKYILDFIVYYTDGRIEFIDVKGYKKGTAYQLFKLKKHLMKAIHDIDVLEK